MFAPLVLAFFIIGITWPLQRWLQSRMPSSSALAIHADHDRGGGASVRIAGRLGLWPGGRALMSDAARYQALLTAVVAWLDSDGKIGRGLWAEHFNVRWLLTKAQYVTADQFDLAFSLMTLTYVILGCWKSTISAARSSTGQS